MAVSHTAIDGATVTIDGPVDLSAPFTSTARLVIDSVVREFTIGPIDARAGILATRPDAAIEEFSYRGGALVVLRSPQRDPSTGSEYEHVIGVWSGFRYSVVLHQVDLSSDQMIGLFDSTEFDESEHGITLSPINGAERYDDPTLVKELPGVGLAEIAPLTRARARELPRWSGRQANGGELYRDSDDDDAPAVLLVAPSATLRLLADDPSRADVASSSAGAITVSWDAAG